ncbi:MAG: AbrB/MazE/SpoVT family DNA-binding domain-containing protein [Planctomycetes bacterium]|nr:AbrB/MazE/SpoVT family DNA-binding domain-containing protein [Planctomycetota bacterium]
MIKRLTKHGNSLALVIDRAILDLLDIKAETPLSITTDGKCLVVTPASEGECDESFLAALHKVNKRHGRALKRLAD